MGSAKSKIALGEVSEGTTQTTAIELALDELEVKHMKVMQKDVKLYFSTNNIPDIKDLIIYIRRQYPNPWQKVCIETDIAVPHKTLEDILIYVKGVNEDKANTIRGISGHCYCPIEIKAENVGDGDYGIMNALTSYTAEYNVNNFDILIYGDDTDALLSAWEYTHDTFEIPQAIYFPTSFSNTLKLFTNGFDIAPYAKRVKEAEYRNELSSMFLRKIMDELKQVIASGKTAIQNFEDTRSTYAQWLTMCLIQECGVPPVYFGSYISEYINLKIAYPFEKLSFYERVNFLRRLDCEGMTVGYVGRNKDFMCVMQVAQCVYPNPTLAFDMSNGEVITDGLERFDLKTLNIIDYRNYFPQSKEYFVEPNKSKSLSTVAVHDGQIDMQLSQLFARMTEKANMPDVYLTFRNTALTRIDGKEYIVYYDEPFGLLGIMYSEYFGVHQYMVYEDEFHRLIDTKIILAQDAKQKAENVESGNKAFQQIMLRAKNVFQPAIPTFVLMCACLTGNLVNNFSYFDRRLRCDKNIVPAITHSDTELSAKKSLFSYINYHNIVNDPVAKGAISAFGSINSDAGFVGKIPVSVDSFRGSVLLE